MKKFGSVLTKIDFNSLSPIDFFICNWDLIVGKDLSEIITPVKLIQYQKAIAKTSNSSNTLVISVSRQHILQIRYMTEEIKTRINLFMTDKIEKIPNNDQVYNRKFYDDQIYKNPQNITQDIIQNSIQSVKLPITQIKFIVNDQNVKKTSNLLVYFL